MFYGQCWKCGERWGLGTASTCTCEPEQPASGTIRFAVLQERKRCAGLRKEVALQGKHSADYEDGFWDALEKYENLIRTSMRDDDDDIQDYVRPWRDLTDAEIRSQWAGLWESDCHPWVIDFVRKVEAKLKEKNHG